MIRSVSQGLKRGLLAGMAAMLLPLAAQAHEGEEHGTTTTLTGEFTVVQADDFERGQAELHYWVKDQVSGRSHRLRFKDGTPRGLKTGDYIKAQGRLRGNELMADGTGVQTVSGAPVAAAVTGERRVLVMLVNFNDASVACTPDAVRNLMFGATASVDGLYRETSFSSLYLRGDVVGPLRINYNAAAGCDYNAWASAADSAAQAAGVVLSNYTQRLYVLPDGVACNWSGLGTLGGSPGRSWVATCGMAEVYAHELGHNFTMHHASTDQNNDGSSDCEYCDSSDVMGYAGKGLMQVNAPHKEQMGWLPTGKVVTPSVSGTYTLAPLETAPGSTPYAQVLKLAKPGTSSYYYFSYRRPVGYDSRLSATYADAVNVHRYDGTMNPTYYIKSLADGGSFSDAAAGFTVTQLSRTADSVTVQVSLPSQKAAPALSVSPVSQAARPGTTLTYTVSLTNRDAAGAGSSTFAVQLTLPTGWTGSVSQPSLILAPGQTANPTVSVTAPAGALSGNYAVGIHVSDALAPVHSASTSAVYAVDAVAPAAPSSLTGTVSGASITLRWGASTDASGISVYEVWRNGIRLAQTTGLTWTDKPGRGTWTYSVRAIDKVGNVSPASASVTYRR